MNKNHENTCQKSKVATYGAPTAATYRKRDPHTTHGAASRIYHESLVTSSNPALTMAAGALVARSRVFSASEPLLLLPLVGAIPTSPLAVEGCVARRAAADSRHESSNRSCQPACDRGRCQSSGRAPVAARAMWCARREWAPAEAGCRAAGSRRGRRPRSRRP